MIREAKVMRVECPACGYRLLDKGNDAAGPVHTKCARCKRVWEVELATGEFKKVSGKSVTRRKGDNDSP